MRMRRKFGLDLDMERRQFADRDGQKVRIGFYRLSEADRQKVSRLLKEGGRPNGN